MKISIIAAAKLLDISAHLLRWRITHQRVLKFATRAPQTVLLADVLRYRDVCSAPLKKPGRPTMISKLLKSIESRYDRAAHSSAAVEAEATSREPILSGRRFGSNKKNTRRIPRCR